MPGRPYTGPVTLPAAEFVGFLLGLLVGSFLNVCIVRVPRDESVVSPGSHCMACGHGVRWYDNIPVVSWLMLRGRCRDCGAAIPARYLAVEVATGLWFGIAGGKMWGAFSQTATNTQTEWGAIFAVAAVGFAVLGFLLIGLIVIDWQLQRLPDAFTLSGIAIGLFLVCTQAIFLGPTDDQIVLNSAKQLRLSSPGSFTSRGNVFLTGPEALIFGRVAAVCGAALILLAVRWGYRALRKRDGMGLGDVKLLAMVAAFLGFWPAVLTLFGGVLLASVYGMVEMIRGRASGSTRLAFGSFMGVAGLAVAIFGMR